MYLWIERRQSPRIVLWRHQASCVWPYMYVDACVQVLTILSDASSYSTSTWQTMAPSTPAAQMPTSANAVGPSLPLLSVPSTPQSMTNSGSRISSGCTRVVVEFITLGRMWIRRSSMIFVEDHRWGAEDHNDHDKGRKWGQSTMTC
jgi:hypothetical protein